jgi:hypothetical protein
MSKQSKKTVFLNDAHDIVKPAKATWAVQTVKDAKGRVIKETWVRLGAPPPGKMP